MLSTQEDGHKVIDIQTPNVSPSTQSVGSANSSGGATDLFSNSPIVPVNNQWVRSAMQCKQKSATGAKAFLYCRQIHGSLWFVVSFYPVILVLQQQFFACLSQ